MSEEIGYKRLRAWQKADLLAKEVYEASVTFPKEEIYSLTSQLRRAALSVPTNIVEGYARVNKNEFRRFLLIALGSLAETEYLLGFALSQGYIKKRKFDELMELKEECGRLTWKLMKSQM